MNIPVWAGAFGYRKSPLTEKGRKVNGRNMKEFPLLRGGRVIFCLLGVAFLTLGLAKCEDPEPGEILEMLYLGTDPPVIPGATFDVSVFYVKYWSEAAGGAQIAAKLFIPAGPPPDPVEGWPARVWLHGFSGPGSAYWHWPYGDEDWREWDYGAGMSFSNHGFISLCPWITGAGPSEPYSTYSPLSIERNAQAAFDGFRALANLPDYFEKHPSMAWEAGVEVVVDNTRQVLSTSHLSSSTMIHFASLLAEHPEADGVKAIVADTFRSGVANIVHCIVPHALELEDREMAAGVVGFLTGPVWCLAEEKGWPFSLFFEQGGIDLYQMPSDTKAGIMPLIRSAETMPLEDNDLAIPIFQRVQEDLGYEPSPPEIFEWMVSDEMMTMLNHETVEGIVSDPFYRTYFADLDPFFEENIEPFSPGIPLLVVASGSMDYPVPGLPNSVDMFHNMIEPALERLSGWGWDVRLFFEEGVEASSMPDGPGHDWTVQELGEILYTAGSTQGSGGLSQGPAVDLSLGGSPVITPRSLVKSYSEMAHQ